MTRHSALPLALLAFLSPFAFGQAPAFEVASIRPGTFSMELLHSGAIGMKIEGSRVAIRGWSLTDLAGAAFGVRTDQISGPDWMGSQRFDIQALIPRGAKPSQVPEMLETMLKDRFGMVARHSQKVAPVYALTVGKGGMKLQPSAPGDTTPSGCARSSGGSRDCHRMSMEELATLLTGLSRMSASMAPGAMGWGIDFPATNLTELKGTFNFALTFGPGGPEEGGGSVVDAIDKLGLRLELQKLPSELIVVDKIEKSPTEN